MRFILKMGYRVLPAVLFAVLLSTSVAGISAAASGFPKQTQKKIQVKPFKKAAPTPSSALLPIVNRPEIREQHRLLADRVLKALPPTCRNNLQNFYVRYDTLDRRGYGGKTTIVLDGNVSDTEFVGLLTHECGHVIHANMAGTSASGPSVFTDGSQIFYNNSPIAQFFAISWERENVLRPKMDANAFASGYGRSDAFEDFAETFTTYALHRDLLVKRAASNSVIAGKLQWMDRYLPVATDSIALNTATWNSKVPWDATKLSMMLIANSNSLTATVR